MVLWLQDFVAYTTRFRGVVSTMMEAIENEESALHLSCVTMRAAGARLLTRAQDANVVRTDIDGADLFALAASLAWLGDQPSLDARTPHLLDVVVSALIRADPT